jgi:hypothetical protein
LLRALPDRPWDMAARGRTGNPTVLYAFPTAVCLVAAIAGFVMQRENRTRLAA